MRGFTQALIYEDQALDMAIHTHTTTIIDKRLQTYEVSRKQGFSIVEPPVSCWEWERFVDLWMEETE